MKKTLKSVLSAILMTAMILSFLPSTAVIAADNYSDAELARAVSLGFGSYKTDNPNVTYAEFMKMLDRAMELADKTKLAAWKAANNKARSSDREILRCEAAVALYLAGEALGAKYVEQNRLYYTGTVASTNPDDPVFDMKMGSGNYDLFDVKVNDVNVRAKYADNFYTAAAYYTIFARTSIVTGQPILETNRRSARLDEKLTYAEALLAALRLYDSELDISERWTTSEEDEILKKAEERKQSILNSSTTVTVKGTKYYVSNKGNDSNDGKSPENAWATIDKVNKADLKPGDGVFFERGGTWRNVSLFTQTGVTYSAYGTGEKPNLYGSPENGANPRYWSLVPGTKNIWVYHKVMNEVGFVVVNDGEVIDNKFVAYWDRWQNKYVVDKERKVSFNLNMLENHQFFNDIDLTGAKALEVSREDYFSQSSGSNLNQEKSQQGRALSVYYQNTWVFNGGKFYFRCDEGNPGEVFKSIEFTQITHGKNPESGLYYAVALVNGSGIDDITLDNLCLMYGGNALVHLSNGATLQNCELAYFGGTVNAYVHPDEAFVVDGTVQDLVDGDDGHAIVFTDPSNLKIINNYVHEGINGAYNFETYLEGITENIEVRGNLFDNVGALGGSLRQFFKNDDPSIVRYRNVNISDNYYMYTGYFSDRARYGKQYPVLQFNLFYPKQFVNVNYTNNVFYLSEGTMITFYGETSLETINFSGNTWVQTYGYALLKDDGKGGGKTIPWDDNAEKRIKELTGDKTAKVLTVGLPHSWSLVTTASNNDGETLSAKSEEWTPPADLSSWAVEGVKTAISRGLATDELQKDYQAATTRAEFCRASVNFLEKYYNKSIAEILRERVLTAKTFADTQDKAIGAAAALGITSGTDTTLNLFSPDETLDREQAATMLYNVIKVIGVNVTVIDAGWTDVGEISAWAKDGTNVMYAAKVMGGTSTTELVFSPKTSYTHEQSVVTLNNLWNYIPRENPEMATITIKGVEYSTSLTELNLVAKHLTNKDIEPLVYMKNLTKLSLDNNQISDISVLRGLTNLTELGIGYNQISDISALNGMTKMISLGLDGNQISDISALSGMTNLTEINLAQNRINDLSALSNMTKLIELEVRQNQLTNLNGLSNLTNLKNLSAHSNQINDISAMSDLTSLESAFLLINKISDVTPLMGLTNLKNLVMGTENPVPAAQRAELSAALPNCKIGWD